MEQGEVIVALPFPANAEATEPIVPRVGSLHDPASRRAAHAPGQRRLSAAAVVIAANNDIDGSMPKLGALYDDESITLASKGRAPLFLKASVTYTDVFGK